MELSDAKEFTESLFQAVAARRPLVSIIAPPIKEAALEDDTLKMALALYAAKLHARSKKK